MWSFRENNEFNSFMFFVVFSFCFPINFRIIIKFDSYRGFTFIVNGLVENSIASTIEDLPDPLSQNIMIDTASPAMFVKSRFKSEGIPLNLDMFIEDNFI